MFVTSIFWSIVFGDLLGSGLIVSLGSKLAVAFMAAEVYLLRRNAELGKNPILNEECRRQEYVGFKAAGIPIPPDEETYVLFRLQEKDLLHKSQSSLARWWLLTYSERGNLFSMMVRHSQDNGGLARERLLKTLSKYKMTEEDIKEVDLCTWEGGEAAVRFGPLKVISDNRLLTDTNTFLAVVRETSSAEDVEVVEKKLDDAKKEAAARKASVEEVWSGKKALA